MRTNSKIFWKKVLKGSICLHFTKVLKNIHQTIQIVYNVSNIPYLFEKDEELGGHRELKKEEEELLGRVGPN